MVGVERFREVFFFWAGSCKPIERLRPGLIRHSIMTSKCIYICTIEWSISCFHVWHSLLARRTNARSSHFRSVSLFMSSELSMYLFLISSRFITSCRFPNWPFPNYWRVSRLCFHGQYLQLRSAWRMAGTREDSAAQGGKRTGEEEYKIEGKRKEYGGAEGRVVVSTSLLG